MPNKEYTAKKIKEKQRQEVLEVYLNNKKLTARKISEILGLTYNQVTKVIRDYKQNDIQRLSNSPSAYIKGNRSRAKSNS